MEQTIWAAGSEALPRAAYIHVPFCAHRCGYCNFSVVAGREDLEGRYLEALARELSWLGEPREVDTLFFGGGTPTRLAPGRLQELLKLARHWFVPSAGAEISVEANPADLDRQRVAVLAAGGVTRISLGAQSFNDAKLAVLERDHRAADVAGAVALAREKIGSVSLDLIFGAPGETADVWSRDLESAMRLSPDHLATYGLTYERGTQFWNRLRTGQLRAVDEQTELEMYAAAIDVLGAAGFEHYEVSNFARPGHRCRHNEVYWSAEEYYAAGPGAAAYVAGRRQTNHRSTSTWLKRVLAGRSPVADSEVLAPMDKAREALVLGLRRLEGIDRTAFSLKWQCDLDELSGGAVRRLIGWGLLEFHQGRLRLTRQGLYVSDSIWPEIVRA